MQEIQARSLHHDDGLAQGYEGINRAGQRYNPQPDAPLLKSRTEDEQNDTAREPHDRDERQQNPQHPLRESRVGMRSAFVIAGGGHSSDNGGEDRVEGLVHFSQTVGGVDDRGINTNRRKRDAGSASDEVSKEDDIQPGNERVNQLICANGSGVTN